MRWSAHLGYLYTELPLQDRVAAAARDGFTAIEHPEPWALPVADWRQRIDDLGLRFAQTSSGMGGAKGLAALPGREGDFREGFLRALDYAQALDCPLLHPMAGAGGEDATYRGNLDWCLTRLSGTGIRLLLQPITTLPGYHLSALPAALALQDDLGAGVALLLDSYHAANSGIDPAAWVRANAPRIGHVHIADLPGRHEPGTGTIDFADLLAALRGTGFAGAVGFEYIPSTTTAESLSFFPGWLQGARR